MTGCFGICLNSVSLCFLVPKSIHSIHVSPKTKNRQVRYDFGRKVVVTSFKFVKLYGKLGDHSFEIWPTFPDSLISESNCDVKLDSFNWQVSGAVCFISPFEKVCE